MGVVLNRAMTERHLRWVVRSFVGTLEIGSPLPFFVFCGAGWEAESGGAMCGGVIGCEGARDGE